MSVPSDVKPPGRARLVASPTTAARQRVESVVFGDLRGIAPVPFLVVIRHVRHRVLLAEPTAEIDLATAFRAEWHRAALGRVEGSLARRATARGHGYDFLGFELDDFESLDPLAPLVDEPADEPPVEPLDPLSDEPPLSPPLVDGLSAAARLLYESLR